LKIDTRDGVEPIGDILRSGIRRGYNEVSKKPSHKREHNLLCSVEARYK
jgi:hypothetical protein